MKKSIKFDLFLLIVFLACSIYFVVELVIGALIPNKYLIAVAIALLILAILLALSLKIEHKAVLIIRRIILVILSVCLLLGGTFQGKIRNAFLSINDGSLSKRSMYVIVKQNSKIDSINEVSSLGFKDQASELMTYSLEQLEEYDMDQIPYLMLDEMFIDLDDEKMDAMMISDQDYALKKDQNEDFTKDYRIIYKIEMSVQNENSANDIDITTKPFVVYVSGLDEMGEPTFNGLSDVNMLLMIDPVAHHVEIVSVNRDSYVPNPKYDDYPDKLTHLGWQGPEATAQVLERIFGIEIDYFAKVTFESLIEIIDTIGGIDVDVQLKFCEQDENRSFASSDLICLNKGYQHLDGKQALAYARHRKTAGWEVKGREQAQRDIIEAIVNKMLSVSGAMKVADVVEVASKYVSTNLPMDKAKAFLNKAIDDEASWTFNSTTVESGYEFRYPTASVGNQLDLSCALLSEKDIRYVHSLYYAITSDQKMSEFAFDLDDMEQYDDDFELDEKVVTVEHYYKTVNKYFPTFLRERF